jgi:hypothetical protein
MSVKQPRLQAMHPNIPITPNLYQFRLTCTGVSAVGNITLPTSPNGCLPNLFSYATCGAGVYYGVYLEEFIVHFFIWG